MTTAAAQPIVITSVGPVASSVLAMNGVVRVAGVCETVFYLTPDDRRFVCFGGPALGRGPLNVQCTVATAIDWPATGVAPDLQGRIGNSQLTFENGLCFAMGAATLWTPDAWPTAWSPAHMRSTLEALIAAARNDLPNEGLAPLVLGDALARRVRSAFARVATLRIAALEDWLTASLAGDDTLDDVGRKAAQGLIGLGPGLTPSGDDFLAGLAIALQATALSATAATLADAVRAAPAAATSPLSRAFLDAAIAGHPSDLMHTLITVLLTARTDDAIALLPRIDRIGHSSGWDMLSGVCLGLAVAAGAPSHAELARGHGAKLDRP